MLSFSEISNQMYPEIRWVSYGNDLHLENIVKIMVLWGKTRFWVYNILLCGLHTVFSLCLVFLHVHSQSHLLSFWCRIYFTSSVSPDHSEGGPSPTVTHPHLLRLAGSLMQNEALTLYQSVKALFTITLISWTNSLINAHS